MGRDATTFETHNPVISILIWLEVDRNLSNVYIEKRSLDGQFSTGVDPNIAVRNILISDNDRKHRLDRHVETPINRDTFFEFAGLAFDTGAVFENEFEVGHRAFLDKIDGDICVNILSLVISHFRAIGTLQTDISVSVAVSPYRSSSDRRLTDLDRPSGGSRWFDLISRCNNFFVLSSFGVL